MLLNLIVHNLQNIVPVGWISSKNRGTAVHAVEVALLIRKRNTSHFLRELHFL